MTDDIFHPLKPRVKSFAVSPTVLGASVFPSVPPTACVRNKVLPVLVTSIFPSCPFTCSIAVFI